MTEFTIRLKTEKPLTRQEAYELYGEIASCLNPNVMSSGLMLFEITDDIAPAVSEPAKPRKPRGKNKPKGEPVSAVVAEANASFEKAFPRDIPPIPASLKRTAE